MSAITRAQAWMASGPRPGDHPVEQSVRTSISLATWSSSRCR